MAWLPGQTCVLSAVDVLYAHSSPARLTTAAHILSPLKSPPTSPPSGGAVSAAALTRRVLSCAEVGSPRQSALSLWKDPWASTICVERVTKTAVTATTQTNRDPETRRRDMRGSSSGR